MNGSMIKLRFAIVRVYEKPHRSYKQLLTNHPFVFAFSLLCRLFDLRFIINPVLVFILHK
jgi:hypothetical protein